MALVHQCYTSLVLKNITITVPEETAAWVRIKAAEENTSIARLVGKLLEREMQGGASYAKAYRKWKKIGSIPGIDAGKRLSREQAHERR